MPVPFHERILQAAARKVAAVLGRITSGNQHVTRHTSHVTRHTPGTDAAAAVTNADLAIEAVTENLALKQKIFSAMDAAAPASCIFASNTSSLSIAAIASATKRSDRFGGLHFFNPVRRTQTFTKSMSSLMLQPGSHDETARGRSYSSDH